MIPTSNELTDVFTFYLGAEVVETITITYTDSSKSTLAGVTKV